MMKVVSICAAAGMVLLLVGCSSSVKRQEPAPVVEGGEASIEAPVQPAPSGAAGDTEVYAYRPSAPAAFKSSSPVYGLVEQAERQRQAGDSGAAAATLERALRIEPRNPHVWNRLARLRLEQGQSLQAGELAAKSNALAADLPELQQDNWHIIASARRQSGDLMGAREAEAKARAMP